MKKTLILFILTIMITLPTFSADWVQTGEKRYIDIDSIERDSNRSYVFSYWTKNLNNGKLKLLEGKYNKKIWYIMCKKVIDFHTNSYLIVELDYYDLNDKLIDYELFEPWNKTQEYYEQYIKALSYYKQNYNNLADISYNEDKSIALLAAMTNNPAMNNMIGRYNRLDDVANQVALLKRLAEESYYSLPWKNIRANTIEYVEYAAISRIYNP